jgi:hypothetical protein
MMTQYKKSEPREPKLQPYGLICPKTMEDRLGAILHVAKDMLKSKSKKTQDRANFIINQVRKAWDLIDDKQVGKEN